jgi:hypothetical protein
MEGYRLAYLPMRRIFTWLNKRFGTFDLLPEYFTAAASQMQNILWGALLPFVAWGIWFIVGSPPLWVNATAIGVALFLAGYYVWRADHVRLQAAFAITQVLPQMWTEPGTGRHAMSYYFEVTNRSETTSIQEVKVKLIEIEPTIENIEWLPVDLRHRHDQSFDGEKTFNLNPGERKLIDFVSALDCISALDKNSRFIVWHTVTGVNREVVGRERRRLRVSITGKDVAALLVWFDVYFDLEGCFVCEMDLKPKNSMQ